MEIDKKYKLADIFKDYFFNIRPKLKEFQSHNNNAGSNPLLISTNMNIFNFSFSDTNKDETIYIMKTIKKTHSKDIYGLNYNCLKAIIATNPHYFTKIINLSFNTGTFPNILKIVVIPILKDKKKKLELNNNLL